MTIEFHADRVTDRQGRALAVGRGRSGSMRRPADPVEIARAAKGFIRSRTWRNWRTAEGQLRLRFPEALQVLAVPALQALTRQPPSPGCHWDSAFVIAVGAGDPEPPRDPAHLELLGPPCGTCQRRQAIDAARQQARDEASAATAAGLPPAKRCAACNGWHRWAQARPLTASGIRSAPGTPTGVLWAAGTSPPQEAAALVAAATRTARPRRRSIAASKAAGTYRLLDPFRRIPTPPYYHRRAG